MHTYSTAGAQSAYLLTQSESLRQKVLAAITAETGSSHDAIIAAACLAGAMVGDWPSAFRILEPLADAADLSDKHRTQIQALHQIREMGTWSRRDGAKQAQQLAALGPDITDIVLLAAGSPNRHLRRDLVTALAELSDPRSVDLLVTTLGDDYSRVRRKAISALVRIGEPAVDALLDALDNDQPQVRKHALVCLGQFSKQGRSRRAHQARHYASRSTMATRSCGGRLSARSRTSSPRTTWRNLYSLSAKPTWENGQLATRSFRRAGRCRARGIGKAGAERKRRSRQRLTTSPAKAMCAAATFWSTC